MRNVLLWIVSLIMVSALVSCAELPGAEVPESESEIQTEAMVESETGKESESEQETESGTEWTPIPLSEKIPWMSEVWPEWENYGFKNQSAIDSFAYWENWESGGWEDVPLSGIQPVGKVMYSTRRQLVYKHIMFFESVPPLDPYYGAVIGALEKGEPVYVEYVRYSNFRPEDGGCYVLGQDESSPVGSVVNGMVLYLSDTPPSNEDKEEIPLWQPKEPVKWEPKEWMEDIWPDWEKWVDWERFHSHSIAGLPSPGDMSFSYTLSWGHGKLMEAYYPENHFEDAEAWAWGVYLHMDPGELGEITYVQTERINRIMYATENQLVYYKIIAEPGCPLKEPYCGFVVGALEKGDAVRVVSVIENQKNPDDPVFYGIAYEPSLGTAPFMDSYIDPFAACFYEGNSGQTAFGFASKLSETPPTE